MERGRRKEDQVRKNTMQHQDHSVTGTDDHTVSQQHLEENNIAAHSSTGELLNESTGRNGSKEDDQNSVAEKKAPDLEHHNAGSETLIAEDSASQI